MHAKNSERLQKQDVVNALKILEWKIEVGTASPEDRESRIKLLQKVDKIDNLEAVNTIQKACIKLDMEGDENTKFFLVWWTKNVDLL